MKTLFLVTTDSQPVGVAELPAYEDGPALSKKVTQILENHFDVAVEIPDLDMHALKMQNFFEFALEVDGFDTVVKVEEIYYA